MLYSELELLGESYPDLMRTFNLQMAKGALEEKLADTGMSVDDLEQDSLERHINELLMLQAGARWKSRHRELVNLREGLYAEIAAERDAQQKLAAAEQGEKPQTVGKAIKGALGGVARAAAAKIVVGPKDDTGLRLSRFASRDSAGRTSFLA